MQIYQFGPFRLETSPNRLLRNGREIHCEPRVLDLLLLLLRKNPEILERGQALEALWPGRIVTDASLSQLVRRARQILGDDGRKPRYIRTIHGRGLQWASPFEVLDEPASGRAAGPVRPRRPLAVAALAMLFMLAGWLWQTGHRQDTPATGHDGNEKIALLPVRYTDAGLQYRWVPLGLMEMVAEMLTGTPGLELVPSREVVAWLATHPERATARELHRTMCAELGCDRLLIVRVSGSPMPERLEYHWETAHYRSPATTLRGRDLLQLAHEMASRIRQPFLQQPDVQPATVSFSGNSQANQAYALAMQARHEGELDLARQYLQIATGQEPDFAMAMAHLSHVEEQLSELELAEQHAQAVLKMRQAPWQARYLALKSLSNIQYSRGDLEASMRTTDELLAQAWPLSASEKGNLKLNTGTTLQRLNRADEARRWLIQAENLYASDNNPLGRAMSWLNLGNVDLGENRYHEAMRWYRQAADAFRRLGHRQYSLIARFQLAVVYKNLSHFDRAIDLFGQLEEESRAMKDHEGALLARIERLDSHNRRTPATAMLIQQLPELISEAENRQLAYPAHLARNLLAHAFWQRQETEKALLWLQWQSPLGENDYNTRMLHALLLWQGGQLDAAMKEAAEAQALAGDGWPENLRHWQQAMARAKAHHLDYAQATADLQAPVISP